MVRRPESGGHTGKPSLRSPIQSIQGPASVCTERTPFPKANQLKKPNLPGADSGAQFRLLPSLREQGRRRTSAKCHRAKTKRAKAGPTPGRPGRRRQVPPLPLSLSARAELIHSPGGQRDLPGQPSQHRKPTRRFVSGLAGNRGAH